MTWSIHLYYLPKSGWWEQNQPKETAPSGISDSKEQTITPKSSAMTFWCKTKITEILCCKSLYMHHLLFDMDLQVEQLHRVLSQAGLSSVNLKTGPAVALLGQRLMALGLVKSVGQNRGSLREQGRGIVGLYCPQSP